MSCAAFTVPALATYLPRSKHTLSDTPLALHMDLSGGTNDLKRSIAIEKMTMAASLVSNVFEHFGEDAGRSKTLYIHCVLPHSACNLDAKPSMVNTAAGTFWGYSVLIRRREKSSKIT